MAAEEDNDCTRRVAGNTTAIASSLDTVATRGAARAWLAAGIRIVALWVGLPALAHAPSAFVSAMQRVVYHLSEGNSHNGLYYTLEAMKEVWDQGGNEIAFLLLWALAAWKAPRIAAWALPLQRRCLRCGYTLGRVSKTTLGTPCPECGEGADGDREAVPGPGAEGVSG